MGRGDKRSRKGKIFKGSYGNSRPHRDKEKAVPAATAAKPASRATKKR
jgi:30S ribosomal protein S31